MRQRCWARRGCPPCGSECALRAIETRMERFVHSCAQRSRTLRTEQRYFPLEKHGEQAPHRRYLDWPPPASSRRRCAHQEYFPSSTIPKTEENKQIIETVEQYRRRLLERNVEGLLVLASEKYFEDSGTPRSDDDYGYDGLKMVLRKRLSRVQSMRYEIEYRAIKHAGEPRRGRGVPRRLVRAVGQVRRSLPPRQRLPPLHPRALVADEKWRFISGM